MRRSPRAAPPTRAWHLPRSSKPTTTVPAGVRKLPRPQSRSDAWTWRKGEPMQKALGLVFALWLCISGPAGAQQAAESPAVAQANALFDEYWEWSLLEYPAFATYV